MAIWAVEQVKRWGGVLEHPAGSSLWRELGLGPPLVVNQHDFGHRATKRTWLYVSGYPSALFPCLPGSESRAKWVVQSSKQDHLPEISKAEREQTPLAFAEWLVALARLTA